MQGSRKSAFDQTDFGDVEISIRSLHGLSIIYSLILLENPAQKLSSNMILGKIIQSKHRLFGFVSKFLN